ncbi:MAG: Double zinc ribbon, partial [Sporomusa sp.]|nr:Double zinc ribbon [Sporomusa sp.]
SSGGTKCTLAQGSLPSYSTNATNKTMVIGSIILVASAFIIIKNHSITALILGVIGIAVLIVGATKSSVPPSNNPTQNIDHLCGSCKAKCELNWVYCAQCGSTLTARGDQLCPHCGMKIDIDWKFCAYCTEEIK